MCLKHEYSSVVNTGRGASFSGVSLPVVLTKGQLMPPAIGWAGNRPPHRCHWEPLWLVEKTARSVEQVL